MSYFKTHFKATVILILLFFIIPSSLVGNDQWQSKSNAEKGILRLNLSDFEEDIALEGEWEFYWEQLLEPKHFLSNNLPKPAFVQVPEVWNNYVIQGAPLDGKGYATYRLRVIAPEKRGLLALNIQNCYTSYKLWVNNQLISQNGKVGVKAETTEAQWIPLVKGFDLEADTIEIVMQVSNFDHYKGGIHKGLFLGDYDKVHHKRELEVGVDLLLFGCLMLIGLFFQGLYLFWKNDKSILYFSLFSIIISYRFINSGTYMILNIFPEIHWQIAARLEYLSFFVGVLFMNLFIRELFPRALHTSFLNVIKGVVGFVSIVTLLSPLSIFSQLIIPFHAVLICNILYAGFVFVKAYRLNYDGAIFAILSIAFLLIAAGTASLGYQGFIPAYPFVFRFGFLIFVFSQTFILSYRFARSFHQVEKLKERTELQKMDIEKQNDTLLLQRGEILKQKEEIIEVNNQVMSSIRYAHSIQSVILPKLKIIQKLFPDSFVYNQPKDVVSGDFPWFLQKENDIYIAAVDCTGHGVPGAFISLIGYFILNDIVNSPNLYEAGEILDKLHLGVNSILKKGSKSIDGDGMDIAFVHISLEEKYIEYAGARRPLYFVQNGNLEIIKGDHFPIGGYFEKRNHFHTAYLDIQKGDSFYLFSDGITDQFGEQTQHKFSPKRMRDIINKHHHRSMIEIKHILIDELEYWKGNEDQTDDILVMGFRI